MSIVGLKNVCIFAAKLIEKTMRNRQLTIGKSIDNIMASDALCTFATDSRAKSRITFSQDKEDMRSSHRTFATETTRSNANELTVNKKYWQNVTDFRPDANL